MKRAFTLIELLVVVAILGILAAILFPVFSRARENGRRASCQSNLKQIGLALLQYTQDYDERLVADWFGPDNGDTNPIGTPGGRYKWMDALQSYARSEQLFLCPSDSGGKYDYYGDITGDSKDYGSYVINHSYRGPSYGTPPVSHPILDEIIALPALAVPSTTAWVLDGNGDFFFGPGESGVVTIAPGEPRSLQTARERHLQTINVLWCDGHVKAVKLELLARADPTNTYMPLLTIEDD